MQDRQAPWAILGHITRKVVRSVAAAGAAVRALIVVAAMAGIALPLSSYGAAAKDEWVSAHFRDHPLAGTIWNANFEAVTPAQLEAALAKARFVLLGEMHDNPDHHRLQARLIDALVRDGRHPAIVFEMIPLDLQADLDRHLQDSPGEATKLGKVLRWEERGWPDWAMYRPIAEAALSAKLTLLAGGLDGPTQKAISKGELSSKSTATAEELDLARPLEPEIAEALGREIKEAHCNLLPAAAMEPMIKVQRARDAYFAKVMQSAKAGEGAVLIAGAGHVRKDWAVPPVIRRASPDAATVSVAFFEVDPERNKPSDYVETIAGAAKPYDFIYFTPRANQTDHCAELEKHLKAKKAGQP